jgi:hypothetical protein
MIAHDIDLVRASRQLAYCVAVAVLLAACAANDTYGDDETLAGGAGQAGSDGHAAAAGANGSPQQGGTGAGNDPDGTSGVAAGAGSNVSTGMPWQDGTEECTAEEREAACAGIACGVAAATCRGSCGACAESESCVDGQCEPRDCGRLEIALDTFASCALDVASGVEIDGEGFIEADGRQHRVFALDRWGTGHFIAWCDLSTLVDVVAAVNARRYLGRSDTARVASFGDDVMCDPASTSAYPLPPWVTYLGLGLPVEYRGDAAALAADWDAIIYCGSRAEWDDAWVATLQAFVSEHGGGLLAALDYAGFDITPLDFAHMNSIIAPTGVSFLEVVNYAATAALSVTDECVPDFVPSVD